MTRLVLHYARQDIGPDVVFAVGKNCASVERAEGGGFWLRIKDVEYFVSDAEVQSMMRGVNPHVCDICGEGMNSAHALKVHKGMKHR